MKRIGIFEAKTRLSAVVAEILAEGEVFHITKHGNTVAELRPPLASVPSPRLGSLRGRGIWMADDFDEPL
jgi:antitoxin (DNA-binding transcriptional repressor) of toxin-antitoxin stability system